MKNLTSVNNTKSSHLMKLQTKSIVGLCRPGVTTDQNLFCFPLGVSNITLTKVCNITKHAYIKF